MAILDSLVTVAVSLLLGGVVAALGGLLGAPQDAPVTHRGYVHGGDGGYEAHRAEGYGPERGEREREQERERERIAHQRAEQERVREERAQVQREQEEYKRR